jgi:hypothetical protein
METFYKQISDVENHEPQIRSVETLAKLSLDNLRTVKGPTRSWWETWYSPE